MSHTDERPGPPDGNQRSKGIAFTVGTGLVIAVGGLLVEYGAVAPWFEDKSDASVSALPSARPKPAGGVSSTDAEKGGIGGNSYCRELLNGPGTVQWRSCAKVENGSIAFGLKLINTGTRPQTVFAQVKYDDATADPPEQNCPGGGRWPLTVPPNETVITSLQECSVPLRWAHFQGKGWVAASEDEINPAAFRWAPSAHVRPSEGKVTWLWEAGGIREPVPLD
ncbi:hypothetical protein [Nonomuraea maritima]|uniref:hypothetical protein n=1 Tax=Nonomuraea maritima TaxID=683260 RepID=UPI00371F3552